MSTLQLRRAVRSSGPVATIVRDMAPLRELMKDASKGRRRPPRLRQATEEQQNCGSCAYFRGGECTLYSYPVRPDQVSDSFKPRRGSM